ncbi:hypothetical protein KKF91_15140 [Myxococcota bacterium]|nr:hypothetical protein [Myxococcota bacterium]MBU1431875.1 hypothetical protein [Myxococcota bacterium]
MPDPSPLSLARDPKTPPTLLNQLARAPSDPQISDAIARNPNAPLTTLQGLLDGHTEAVLANPALPLHLLAQPNALYPLTGTRLRALARHQAALGQILGWREGGWSPLRLTLACVAAADEHTRWLPSARRPGELGRLRARLIQRGALPTALLEQLVHDPDPEVRAALASAAKAPWQFEALLDDPTLHERLLSNPHCPEIYLDGFMEHPDPHVRRRIPEHSAARAEQLIELARDPEPEVRAAVARHRALPAEAARWLRYDAARAVYEPLWPDSTRL